MNNINHLKKDHKEIFKKLLEFEEIIDKENLDYEKLIHVFHNLLVLISQHEKKKKSLFRGSLNHLNKNVENLSVESKFLRGHIKVINESLLSKDNDYVKVALDNDGRMLISRIKKHIFMEEMILDKLLFLHMAH